MTDLGTDTRIVLINGRSIVVRQLRDAQLTLLAREAKVIQRPDRDRQMDAAARMFNILESAVVQDSDREFLLDEITIGKIELKDILTFISVFSEEEEGPEKPKVRRGRPPIKRT